MQLTKTTFSDSATFTAKKTVENRLWAKREFLMVKKKCATTPAIPPWPSAPAWPRGRCTTGQRHRRTGAGPAPSSARGPGPGSPTKERENEWRERLLSPGTPGRARPCLRGAAGAVRARTPPPPPVVMTAFPPPSQRVAKGGGEGVGGGGEWGGGGPRGRCAVTARNVTARHVPARHVPAHRARRAASLPGRVRQSQHRRCAVTARHGA